MIVSRSRRCKITICEECGFGVVFFLLICALCFSLLQVVFVGDTYVPVTTQLRSRPISTADQPAVDWRLQTFEGWGDARRQGSNNTRVQRKYLVGFYRTMQIVE